MKQQAPSNVTVSEARCEECGRFGALDVAGRWLCEQCYCLHGSCCTEFTPERLSGPPAPERAAADEQSAGDL